MVRIEPKGRFAQMFAAGVRKKDLSLDDVAAKLDMAYEHMRKVWIGRSAPSKLLLKELCKMLNINYSEAQKAVTADKLERKYGKSVYTAIGSNPRFSDIEDVLPTLTDTEWAMFVSQIRGFAQQKGKSND